MQQNEINLITKRYSIIHTLEKNLRQDRRDRRSHSMDLLIPRRSQQCTTATHTKAMHRQGPIGGLPSLSLTTKGFWMHLGEGRQASRQQPSDASTLG